MPLLFSLFSVRGEIGRGIFWLITVAATIVMLASIIYVEENFNAERKGVADLAIAGTYVWVVCAAIIRRVRDIGLTVADLLLLLFAAVWMAANFGLLREIAEAMKVLHDLNYLPNPTGAAQIALWGLVAWSGITLFILAFVSGEQRYEPYRPAVRKYARRKTVALVIILTTTVLLILRFYIGAR